MEAAQPFLQPAMVGIDVVEVKIWRSGVWFAGHRQNMRGNSGPARESDNRRATVAAEFVGRRDDPVQRRGNRRSVQFRARSGRS